MEPYLYFGSLGPHERQFQIPNFIGLALEPAHEREIQHDLTAALPYDDDSIAKIQAQDVLEHLPFENVPFVLDEIYRVLKPGGIFRLSVPDYRSPVHNRRSLYDCARTGDRRPADGRRTSYLDPASGRCPHPLQRGWRSPSLVSPL